MANWQWFNKFCRTRNCSLSISISRRFCKIINPICLIRAFNLITRISRFTAINAGSRSVQCEINKVCEIWMKHSQRCYCFNIYIEIPANDSATLSHFVFLLCSLKLLLLVSIPFTVTVVKFLSVFANMYNNVWFKGNIRSVGN